MEHDRAVTAVSGHDSSSLKAALLSPRVWFFGLLYFTIVVGFYGITFWLPQILKNLSGLSDVKIGMVSAIPYVIAAIVMVAVAASSDRAGERRWHVAIPSFVSAVGLLLSAATRDPILSIAALSLAAAGIWGSLGPFWSLPTAFLTGAAAAGGIALINSLGNLGGFLSPMLIGEIRARTDSFAIALFVLAAAPLMTGLLVLFGVRGGVPRKEQAPEPLQNPS
jgi:nitrate/nitrite transporter NarK